MPIAGHLWTTGFRNGDLKTPLFADVLPTLQVWKAAGKTLAIFSSGSVQAQLQFFSFVQDGESTKDIKPLFSAHYDTVNAGPKLEPSSYEKICSELGKDVSKVTFLTDNVKGTFVVVCHTLHETTHHRLTAQPNPPHPPERYQPRGYACTHSHTPLCSDVIWSGESSASLALLICSHSQIILRQWRLASVFECVHHHRQVY